MAIINRKADGSGGILGAPADLGPKANQVDGDMDIPQRAGLVAGNPAAVNDQASLATAQRRDETQQAFRQAQHDAGLISADQGAGGTRVAASGSAVVGQIPDGTLGDTIGAPEQLVTRADGADDPSQSAYGKGIA